MLCMFLMHVLVKVFIAALLYAIFVLKFSKNIQSVIKHLVIIITYSQAILSLHQFNCLRVLSRDLVLSFIFTRLSSLRFIFSSNLSNAGFLACTRFCASYIISRKLENILEIIIIL